MIRIYSVDSNGKLFTDEKQHFYIDSELLHEKSVVLRTWYTLNQIAIRLGWQSYNELSTFARCTGITESVLINWIISGNTEFINRNKGKGN